MIRRAKYLLLFCVAAALLGQGTPSVIKTAAPMAKPSAIVGPGTSDIHEVIQIFNGVWKLDKRYNPDGSEFQDVRGTTTIELKPFYSKFGPLGARALGTIHSEESGIYDPRCRACAPAEALGKRFEIESNGTWAVGLLAKGDRDFPSGEGDFAVSVTSFTKVVSSFTPYKEGLNAEVNAYYRVKRGERSLELLNQLKFGKDAPVKNNRGDLIAQETVDEAS